MHIPDNLLNGTICPVTAAISMAGVATATYFSIKSKEKPDAIKFGIVTALIFVLQMLNFPISGGTSGHFLGTSFAIFSLGIPYGILSISLILTLQAIVFADGGLTVLGANILNMALIGSIPAILVYKVLKTQKSLKSNLLIASSSWLSIVLASASCSLLLSIVYPNNTGAILTSMIVVHSIIGIGEAIITLIATPIFNVVYKSKTSKFTGLVLAGSIFTMFLLLTPFASKLPDGLEWVVEKYNLLKETESLFVAPLPDYNIPLLQNEVIGTILSGIAGILLIISIAFLINLLSGFIKSKNIKKA